jgi:hypothetical protein
MSLENPMLDDLRKDHDPRPSPEEREWMAGDVFGYFARFMLLLGIAIMLGVSASVLFDRYIATPTVASTKAPG